VEDIRIGAESNVQDCCALHADEGFPLRLGDQVSVGHGAVLHGCAIGDRVLVGMAATIMNGTDVGADTIVGAGSLVTPGTVVPSGSLVLGSPARVVRPLTDEERRSIGLNAVDYAKLARQHADASRRPAQ